ncbi:adenosine deaminase-like protein [Mercenaria mercenaria]|uniref:adenosine deaminase-like protein n=1 Tax=Mercenaria mercenaria TaxID=6596 RepID=UPI00234E71AC|nr:adenosine deaminase-like protein [Mercenaria mercenaria]XP_045215949.2 adenosine deaminase-like protein [Mercenaria mercenaria]XP_045215951.2 adenosine deaminase-like protein [Mercenaria mercenaria]XP_053406119.1 adenosine deaminase-like protein [Mercenaria mercenaria]XP_053406120.1 adenosine deaminase-like protein [Mercenaria mercenaria]
MSEDFFKKLPKVELHAHINGSISESTMHQLVEGKQITYNPASLKFKKGETGTLKEVFKLFKQIHEVTNNEKALYKVTYDVIHEFAEENVKYIELRTTPREELSTGMTKTSYIETVLKAIRDCAKENLDIIVKLILAIDRRQTLQVAMDTVQLAVKYREESKGVVVGIDLSGDPNVGNADVFIPAFKEAQKHGLKLALHLAEVPAPEETMTLLQEIIPDRIGHGTCLQPDAGGTRDIVQFVESHKIPLELCLSSNIINMTVPGYDNHHFKFWYDLNHPCVICTDDKGVFSTSLTEEYSVAADTFQLSREQVWELSYNSINSIFSDDNTKQLLRDKWKTLKDNVQNH